MPTTTPSGDDVFARLCEALRQQEFTPQAFLQHFKLGRGVDERAMCAEMRTTKTELDALRREWLFYHGVPRDDGPQAPPRPNLVEMVVLPGQRRVAVRARRGSEGPLGRTFFLVFWKPRGRTKKKRGAPRRRMVTSADFALPRDPQLRKMAFRPQDLGAGEDVAILARLRSRPPSRLPSRSRSRAPSRSRSRSRQSRSRLSSSSTSSSAKLWRDFNNDGSSVWLRQQQQQRQRRQTRALEVDGGKDGSAASLCMAVATMLRKLLLLSPDAVPKWNLDESQTQLLTHAQIDPQNAYWAHDAQRLSRLLAAQCLGGGGNNGISLNTLRILFDRVTTVKGTDAAVATPVSVLSTFLRALTQRKIAFLPCFGWTRRTSDKQLAAFDAATTELFDTKLREEEEKKEKEEEEEEEEEEQKTSIIASLGRSLGRYLHKTFISTRDKVASGIVSTLQPVAEVVEEARQDKAYAPAVRLLDILVKPDDDIAFLVIPSGQRDMPEMDKRQIEDVRVSNDLFFKRESIYYGLGEYLLVAKQSRRQPFAFPESVRDFNGAVFTFHAAVSAVVEVEGAYSYTHQREEEDGGGGAELVVYRNPAGAGASASPRFSQTRSRRPKVHVYDKAIRVLKRFLNSIND